MKQKQKKKPIKKKMVFRTHIILTIEGRLMDFLIAGCGLVFLYYLFKDSFNKGFNWVFCVGVVFIEAFLVVGVYINRDAFIVQPWAKLIIYDDQIVWRCIFYRPVVLRIDEIRYTAIREFNKAEGGGVPDLYGVGRLFVILSKDPIPSTKLIKLYSGNGLIKFKYTEAVANRLKEVLPGTLKNPFQSRPFTNR